MICHPPDFPSPGGDGTTSPVPQLAAEEPTTTTTGRGSNAAGEAIIHDERGGLPSASSFNRYSACRGSIALEFELRGLGQLPEDHETADSDRGTRIHDILARFATGEGDPTRGAAADEVEVAESLWERAQDQVTRTFGTNLENLEVSVEERFWLNNSNGTRLASGKFDLVAHDGNRGLVIDYKTLYGVHPEAAINRQLMFGAVVVREYFGVTEVRGALIQNMKPTSSALYGPLDLEDGLEEIDTILLRKGRDPFELGFVRGEHCKFCPARLACPRLQWDKAQLQVSPLAIIRDCTDEQLGQFGKALESVKHLGSAFVAEATARINCGRHVPGFSIDPGRTIRQVSKPRELANALIAAGAPLTDVLGAMSMSVGDAERIHKAATGLKGKDAAAAFTELAGGMIERTEPKFTLKSV